MLKIVHLVRRFAPSDWGGIESAVFNLCKQLKMKGVDSPIFTTTMLAKPGKDSYQGVEIRRFPHCFPWFFLDRSAKKQLELKGGSPLSLSLLWGLLFERHVSLIHTHVQLRLGGIARTVARWKRIPYVVSIHGGYLTLTEEESNRLQGPTKKKWEWGKLFGWWLGSRRVLEDAQAIICVGLDEYEALRIRFPSKKLYYLPNGVDETPFVTANPHLFREEIQLNEEERIVLCVSRIDPQKNQLLLIQAFSQFLKRFPNYRLVLIGPISVESYAHQLLDLAQNLGVNDQVHLIPGYAPENPLLYSAYKAADFFVLPSVLEPFGIVILEAWAAGLPVIASRVGGVPGFTQDSHNVLLFESGDEKMLLEQMSRLASQPSLKQQLSTAGCESVKNYTWSHIVDQLMEIYRESIVTGLSFG